MTVAAISPFVLQHVPLLVFVFCFGACVGSFLNVVIYRLPAGMSVITPPSRCPTCGARLKFFRENLPIIGWFMIRGRCRYCGVRVSPQYMLIELLMALVLAGLYAVLFMVSRHTPWWGEIGGAFYSTNGFLKAWPTFTALAFLIAGLVAMTVIDARTFTIPIQIPLFVTITAFIAYPIQSLLPHRSPSVQDWPIPGVGWTTAAMAVGGMLGVLAGVALLRLGVLKYSFADYHEYVDEGETLGDYPHARREMTREILFLLPCLLGLGVGAAVGAAWLPATAPPELVQAIGATFAGYLAGGALIWGIRILGTLAFGREAMGLGDVHLLGAVGAVLGWLDPVWIFFIAPFSGIAWVVVSMSLSSVFKLARRELPYGPHLAAATLAVVFLRPGLDRVTAAILPTVPLPERGLVLAPPDATPAPRGSDLAGTSATEADPAADNLTSGPRRKAGA